MNRLACITTVAAGIAILLGLASCARQVDSVEAKASPAEMPAKARSPVVDAALIAAGEKVFGESCAKCHSVNGVPDKSGPDLSDFGSERWSPTRVIDTIRDFQRYYPGSMMPTWDEAYPEQDLQAVAAYVMSLKKQAFYVPNETEE